MQNRQLPVIHHIAPGSTAIDPKRQFKDWGRGDIGWFVTKFSKTGIVVVVVVIIIIIIIIIIYTCIMFAPQATESAQKGS